MKPRLVTLFYGSAAQQAAYRPLLLRWLAHHRDLGLAERLLVVTDLHDPLPHASDVAGLEILALDTRAYHAVRREGQPFDQKGALLCELLLQHPGAFLFLDLDAWLQRAADLDHPDLAASARLAMPRDLGALNCDFGLFMWPPFAHYFKRCAGVMWCGPRSPGQAQLITDHYRAAWRQLVHGHQGGVPWEKHLDRLLEQHAWSVAAQRLDQPLLSDAWNWPAHIAGYAAQEQATAAAHVHHHFGRKKWAALGRKAPRNV